MARWLKTLLMLLPGCATGAVIRYQHAPTAAIRQTFNLDDPALAPFTVGGVVLSPELASVSHDDRQLVLYLLSQAEASVTVMSWRLGVAGEPDAAHQGAPGQAVPVRAREAGGRGYTGEIVLTEVKNAELESLFQRGPCTLTLSVTPGEGGADATLVFTLERTEREVTGIL